MSYETQRAMEALLELSGFPRGKLVDRMVKLIAKAPDPETACRVITDEFQATGALERKWRKVINQTWQSEHNGQAYPLDLALTSQDVARAEALTDTLRLLEELARKPALLTRHEREHIFAPDELQRLVKALPSVRAGSLPDTLEHEWSCVRLRRLRLLLQTLKLVRVYGGKLHVVASRYQRFLSMPLPQQYYMLWHTDVYHMPWGHFAASWAPYVDTIQEYLPLMWDIAQGTQAGQTQNVSELTYALLDLYQPLWEQEGVVGHGQSTFMTLYEEHALPTVVTQLIVRDVFARYGLIQMHEGLPSLIRSSHNNIFDGSDVSVRWTSIGQALIEAESSGDLPCGLDMID